MRRRKSSSSPLMANDRRLSQTQSANSGGGSLRNHEIKNSRISSYLTASPYGGSVTKMSEISVRSAAGWLLIFSVSPERNGNDFSRNLTRSIAKRDPRAP